MTRYLFVGGYADGRYIDVPRDQADHLVPEFERQPLVPFSDVPAATTSVRQHHYRRHEIAGSRQVTDHPSGHIVWDRYILVEFFAPAAMDADAAIRQLVSGYGGVDRRRTEALRRIANINNGPDRASGEYRCFEAADIAERALDPDEETER